jgi:hypothetical protein
VVVFQVQRVTDTSQQVYGSRSITTLRSVNSPGYPLMRLACAERRLSTSG